MKMQNGAVVCVQGRQAKQFCRGGCAGNVARMHAVAGKPASVPSRTGVRACVTRMGEIMGNKPNLAGEQRVRNVFGNGSVDNYICEMAF